MPQDSMPALSGLDSFEQLDNLLAARRLDGSPEAMMTFEAFEVALAQVMRRVENELKAADLARYDVDAEAVMVNGQEWRKCLANQPKTYLSASGPLTVSRNLYRPVGGGKSICPLELSAGIIGGLHTPGFGPPGGVSDGAPDLRGDQPSVWRVRHRGSLE